ncbi:MAG: hypothetical protein QNI95_04190 [Desulfobacterales bacterium]|nr:hypothetical protein [Desulfobacterales bacterium]
MMKRFWYINLALLIAASLMIGCAQTKSFTDSVKSVTPMGKSSKIELYDQVPNKNRWGIPKAELDLRIAQETVKLAELRKELAAEQETFESQRLVQAKTRVDENEIELERLKWESIDRSGLGEKDKNIIRIADLKVKKLDFEGNRIKIEAKMANSDRKINDLKIGIKEQEALIRNLKKGYSKSKKRGARKKLTGKRK